MMNNFNYFFLLPSNPWPLMVSFSTFNLMMSFLIYLKYMNFYFFFFNLLILILLSFMWWFVYSMEFNLEGKNSLPLESSLKFSMILFISSEIFFFFSFFWMYFHFFFSPAMEIGLNWPPVLILMFDYLNVPLINTIVLLSSGVTVTISHFYLINSHKKNCLIFLLITLFLGLFFTFLQALEYKNSFFSISDSNFGSSFFILTGFHGIHVIIGTLFLIFVFSRILSISSSWKNYFSFELASWYWHFVDVVWIFLYFFIYYLNF